MAFLTEPAPLSAGCPLFSSHFAVMAAAVRQSITTASRKGDFAVSVYDTSVFDTIPARTATTPFKKAAVPKIPESLVWLREFACADDTSQLSGTDQRMLVAAPPQIRAITQAVHEGKQIIKQSILYRTQAAIQRARLPLHTSYI